MFYSLKDAIIIPQENGIFISARRVSAAPIYGVSWDKSSNPVLTRTDDAVGKVANAGVGNTPVTNDFDTCDIFKDITEVTDDLGNVFIRIPKFYIEKTNGATRTWRISKTPFSAACYSPACFGADGFAYIGKYLGSLNGSNLESKASKVPLVSKNIVDYRTYARNNGSTYQMLDIHAVDVLQVLFTIEFATLNSQGVMHGYSEGSAQPGTKATVAENNTNRIIIPNNTGAVFVVGQGIKIGTTSGGSQVCFGRSITSIDAYDASNTAISFDGAPVNIAINNNIRSCPWVTGFSSGINATTGILSDAVFGKYPCKYRGMENPWDSCLQFVDGINISNKQAYVCSDPSSYASNLFTYPYQALGYVNAATNGYIVELGFDSNFPFAELPTVVGGSGTTYYSDQYYTIAGNMIAYTGGPYTYTPTSTMAGIRHWGFNAPSNALTDYLGGRLQRKI